jgi:choline kinase
VPQPPFTRTGALDVVVLAAGRGSRLGPLGEETPKWLLDVGGTTIAARQLAGIAAARASTIRVVTGHAAGAIERFAAGRPDLRLVHNPRYADRNNWFSVFLALRDIGDTERVVVFNGDLCAEPDWFTRFLLDAASTPRDALIAVDLKRALTNESMKVAARAGALQAIGKTGVAAPVGEYVGMLMARGAALARLRAALEALERTPAAADAWYEQAVAETVRAGVRWQIWPTPDSRWVEIDDGRDHVAALGIAA